MSDRRWDRRTTEPAELPLFTSLPAQRTSATSIAAAAAIAPHVATQRQRVLSRLQASGGKTNEELARELTMRTSSVTGRVRELVKAGLVRDSGQTRPTSSGVHATIWIAT